MPWDLFTWGDAGWGDELWYGFQVTVCLSVLSYAIGLLLGLVLGLLEQKRGCFLAPCLSGYAAVLRSLPELLIIFAVYFGLAAIVQSAFASVGVTVRLSLTPFVAGLIAISIITGAYASEVVKGAVLAVPRGLVEASRSLGLSRWQTLWFFTIPIASRTAFPGLANIWMAVIKKTPLVSAIQLEDFIRAAGTAGQNTKHFFVFYGAVIVFYLLLSALSMGLQIAIEQRLYRYQGRRP